MPTDSLIAPVAGRIVKDRFFLLVRSADAAEAMRRISQLLHFEGYFEERPCHYGRGSKAGRHLVGGLSSRQEFTLTASGEGDIALITLASTATVLTAGAIGIGKAKKELARLVPLLLRHFDPLPAEQEASAEWGQFEKLMKRPAGQGGLIIMIVIMIMIAIGIVAGLAAAHAVVKF